MGPCSRIGHLFREEAFRPYTVSIRQVVSNYKRLAHVWLKDHIEYWYLVKPEARAYELHDIESMHEQHDDLKCRNMSWYLENIDHEMLYEMDKICIPDSASNIGCKASKVPGRSCVDSDGIMPREAYLEAREAADKRLAAEGLDELVAAGSASSRHSEV